MTNAAGGLNSEYDVGDIVLLNDVRKNTHQKLSSRDILTWVTASLPRRSGRNSSIERSQ